MNELKYKIIRAARKTVAIQIKPDKTVIVRAPKRMSKEQMHSLQFYEEVRRVFPEYDKWSSWLKTYGPDLMKRMTMKKRGEENGLSDQ